MNATQGMTLGGRYRLDEKIAAGGMGEVWRGTDSLSGDTVAIKTLKENASGNETFLKRFENEATNASGLDHPSIAQVRDFGVDDRVAYLVMELVDGVPLSSILERERTLAEERLVRLLIATCGGLQVAHDSGVIHRDVKPGNLLVTADDEVKITDFGVSRSTDQTTLTATGMVMGTAQYLAPELALGKAATPASDLYALGIVAYESVVGKRPFTASTPVDIAIAHVNEKVPPLPEHVSPDLAAVIMTLLDKNPRRRPRSAARLAEQLAQVRLMGRERPSTPAAAAPRARRMPPSIAPKEHRPRPDIDSNSANGPNGR